VAILKTNKYQIDTTSVLEDPIPTSNYIYFQNDAYNKTTLSPQFDIFVQHNTAGTTPTSFGTRPQQGYYGSVLVLNGPTAVVHCDQSNFNANNNYYNVLDVCMWGSMSTTYPCRWQYYYTDGTNTSILNVYQYTQQTYGNSGFNSGGPASNTIRSYWEYRLNPGTDLTKSVPLYNTTPGADDMMPIPVYVNPSTKNLVAVPYGVARTYGYNAASWFAMPGWATGAKFGQMGTGAPGWTYLSTDQRHYTVQFLGPALDGNAVFFNNYVGNDFTQLIYRYNDAANTSTTLSNPTAAPTAGGSSLGGDRGTNFGNYMMKTASCTFTDPLLGSGTLGWYVPYFDTSGNYVPFYFQWTLSTNNFIRNTNITINWGGRVQSTIWSVDTISNGIFDTQGYDQQRTYGMQRVCHNETWTYTAGGTTTRYLMLMQAHAAGGIYDAYPLIRTFVVFSMNATNPLSLTYHSNVVIPVTPRAWVWLNLAKTIMGIFTYSYFYTYGFTTANGWSLTGSLPYKYWAAGVDGSGRIWAIDNSTNGNGIIHLITPSVPVNVVVTPAQTTYNYTGTTISSTIAVSTYDQTGTRISTQVKLVIDGGSMTFGGNNLTSTVTTSTSADITVAISITDGGYSNIIASVVLS